MYFHVPKIVKKEITSGADENDNTEAEILHQLVNINEASSAIETVCHIVLEQRKFMEGL